MPIDVLTLLGAMADCFAAALAMILKAVVLTSDPELEVLGKAVPRIRI